MELELRAYRADPTDARFAAVYHVASPWLKSAGISTIKTYPTLSFAGDLDDVVLEGAFALARSARRFVYLCADCGRAFVDLGGGRGFIAHQRKEHRVRGGYPLVGLATFASTSARLAMKRTARRLLRPEVLEPELEAVEAALRPYDDVEAAMLFEILVQRVRERLTARARVNLEILLRREVLGPEDVADLREQVAAIVHHGYGGTGGRR
jgi:hypothetical protein